MALNELQAIEDERKRKEAEFQKNMTSSVLPGVNNSVLETKKILPTLTQDEVIDQLQLRKMDLINNPNIDTQSNQVSVTNRDNVLRSLPFQQENKIVQPTSNWIKNETTGETFTIAANGSINGGPVPSKSEGRMGGYNPDGTSITPSGKQGDQDALGNTVGSEQQNRVLQNMQWRERQGFREVPEVAKGLLQRGDLPGMSKQALREYNDRILANMDPNKKEENRINEMNVKSQNKLRDIQGQVALDPRMKENALKPIVTEEADPNDPTGMSKRQVINMPKADGTGYVNNQSNVSNSPQVNSAQRAKINAYIKANPNVDKATIMQKISKGEF